MADAINCLIVDDDPDDQEIFIMCIEKLDLNINCKTCDNGVEAMSMLESNPEFIPDYIFLDVNMPKMNGIECLQEFKKIEKLKQSKIYMYSTTTERKMVDESKRLGAHDFIIKPTKTSELTEKLQNIFKSPPR